MGEWWEVACEYRLINRCIAGAMKLLTRYINFSHVRANSARMILHTALPQGQVLIWEKTTKMSISGWKLLSMAADVERIIQWIECQQSVNESLFCKSSNYTEIWSLLCITNVLAAFIIKRNINTVTALFWEWASTERQRFLASHLGSFIFRLVAHIHSTDIGSLYWEKLQRHADCGILMLRDISW